MASNMVNVSYFSPAEVKFVTGNHGILGRGSFGRVLLGTLDVLGIVAIKCIPISGSKHEFEVEKQKFVQEIKMMQKASHMNVVRVLGFTKSPGIFGIIMEVMLEDNLSDLLFLFECDIVPILRLQFCYDITHGMTYLHYVFKDKRLVHGDLKPTNILLTSDLRCKISDFGGAFFSTCSEYASKEKLADRIEYTEWYVAPEFHKSEKFQTTQPTRPMDVYSTGVIFQDILTRKKPEELKQNEFEETMNALKAKYSVKSDIEIISTIHEKMILCQKINPDERPSMMEIRDAIEPLYSKVPTSEFLKYATTIVCDQDMKYPSIAEESILKPFE